MTSSWYCTDCETRIEKEAIEDHESRGHHVSGAIRPDRLLGNDPWNLQLEVEGELEGTSSALDEEGSH